MIKIDDKDLSGFLKAPLVGHHDLHQSPLFNDEGIIKIIDNYPREKLEIFTMGNDSQAWGDWHLGRLGNLDGRQLFEAVKNGRLWLNLRKSNANNREIDEVCEQMFAEVKQQTGVTTYKHDMGMLISSPNAHVFYHSDMPLVFLLQIRGVKKVYLYPDTEPFINDAQLEGIAIKEKDEQLKLDPEWDKDALVHDLKPGEFLSWPQNAPHRIVNEDCVNISFSIEFMTPQSMIRANILYANGCLRRYHGLHPSLKESPKILNPLKLGYARIIKAMGGYKGNNTLPKPKFSLDEQKLGEIKFD